MISKQNFAIFPVLDWIATLATHSNVSKGKRKKEKQEIIELDPLPASEDLRSVGPTSSKRSFSTWVYGKSPMPHRIAKLKDQKSLSTLLTPGSFELFLP